MMYEMQLTLRKTPNLTGKLFLENRFKTVKVEKRIEKREE